jgi:hypothetical protein
MEPCQADELRKEVKACVNELFVGLNEAGMNELFVGVNVVLAQTSILIAMLECLAVIFALAGKAAQPEGLKILTKIIEFWENVIEHDEPHYRPVRFHHSLYSRKWKEKRQLHVAHC